jgi:hypothetical protein
MQALEASLRSLRLLGDLFSPCDRRIDDEVLVVGPGASGPVRIAAGDAFYRNPASHRCTCAILSRRKTDASRPTDH